MICAAWFPTWFAVSFFVLFFLELRAFTFRGRGPAMVKMIEMIVVDGEKVVSKMSKLESGE